MFKKLDTYIEQLKDENSSLYAGSAIFMVAYLQLSNIAANNASLTNIMNHYKSFAFDMILKDAEFFSVDNEKLNSYKLMDMVDNYIHFANYIEGVANNFGQCKECCSELCNDYPILTHSARALKSIANNTCKMIDYDIFEAYEKEDYISDYNCSNDEVLAFNPSNNEVSAYAYKICASLLIKLLTRRLKLGNKNNLPLEETLNLSNKLLVNSKLEASEINKIKDNLMVLFNNTKSSVKMDYLFVKNIITCLED